MFQKWTFLSLNLDKAVDENTCRRKLKSKTMVNSVDPDETARNEPSHLDLHCLHRYCFWSPRLKGLFWSPRLKRLKRQSQLQQTTLNFFFFFFFFFFILRKCLVISCEPSGIHMKF